MNISFFGMEININKKVITLGVAAIIIAVVLGVIGYKKLGENSRVYIGKVSGSEDTANIGSNPPIAAAATAGNTETKPVLEEIKVYVVGCVKNQGIVTLKKGQIIYDAVNLAGGLTKDADAENINMAYILTENTMIKIKSKKEIQSENRTAAKAQTISKPKSTGVGAEIIKDSGGAVLDEAKESSPKSGKININTATKEELDTLPRIGEKTAEDIIAYRQKAGGFKKIEDIKDVPRIGDKTFEDLKDLIDIK